MASEYEQQAEAVQRKMTFFFLLPFILLTIIFVLFAWNLAKNGTRYAIVKLVAFPAAFIISTAFGAGAFVCFSVFLGFFVNPDIANYAVANWADLSLYVLWGPIFLKFVSFFTHEQYSYNVAPTIPIIQIVIYQVILYALVTHRVSRQLALAIYDSAVHAVCRFEGSEPRAARNALLILDAGYAKDAGYYVRRGTPAGAAVFSVLISGGNLKTYFID